MQYVKNLHYAIAHLRRADGGLRPKAAANASCSMNLSSEGQRCRIHFVLLHFKFTNFLIAPVMQTICEKDPLYCFWFFEAYYKALKDQLSVLSKMFDPTREADVEELFSFTAVM
jgi:hypothetical protein